VNLTVIGPRVFIKPESLPDMNEAGTLHLVNYRSQSTMKGTVVALGNGPEFVDRALTAVSDRIDNKYVRATVEAVRADFGGEHLVKVGDHVIFSPASGEELVFEKEIYVSMSEEDILAIIEE
jgi:co-chaperonin GroES (HSP10)